MPAEAVTPADAPDELPGLHCSMQGEHASCGQTSEQPAPGVSGAREQADPLRAADAPDRALAPDDLPETDAPETERPDDPDWPDAPDCADAPDRPDVPDRPDDPPDSDAPDAADLPDEPPEPLRRDEFRLAPDAGDELAPGMHAARHRLAPS